MDLHKKKKKKRKNKKKKKKKKRKKKEKIRRKNKENHSNNSIRPTQIIFQEIDVIPKTKTFIDRIRRKRFKS